MDPQCLATSPHGHVVSEFGFSFASRIAPHLAPSSYRSRVESPVGRSRR